MPFERFLFSQFWNALALGGAVSEYVLFQWFAAPFGIHLSTRAAVVGVLVLAAVNRLATTVLDHEPGPGPVAERVGRSICAVAFGAGAGAAALAVFAGAWAGLQLLGAQRGEAGATEADLGAVLFGGGFRPVGTAV